VEPERIRPCSEVKGILKFECTFTDEKDVVENTMPRPFFGAIRESYLPLLDYFQAIKNKGQKPEKLGKAAKRRPSDGTSPLLEVDYFKRSVLSHFTDLAKKGVRRWQFEQAMINLTLSMALSNGEKHYNSTSAKDLRRRIVDSYSFSLRVCRLAGPSGGNPFGTR